MRAALCGFFLIPVLVFTGLSSLSAQSILVRVLDSETRTPIQGAFVTLLRGDGDRVQSALTNQEGRYLFVGFPAGTLSLRVEMIGRETVETSSFEVGPDEAVEEVLEISYQPFELAELRVESERQCVVRPEEGRQTARVWEEARKALEVAAWAQEEELFRYRLVRRVRELDPDGETVVKEDAEHLAGFFREPFASRSPEDLGENGFVQVIDGDTLAFAPGAAVLLSPVFLETHCLRLEERPSEGVVGVAFEPVEGRRVPDIRGVVWLDGSSWRLRTVEFRFTRFPGEAESPNLGGEVEFHQLPSGAWIVRDWHVRMPLRGVVRERVTAGFTEGIQVVAIWEEGGEVLSVSDQAGRIVTATGRAILTGSIFDSIRGAPLSEARVTLEGTSYEARTDSAGSFRIDDLSQGRFSVRFSHPWMDSIGIAPEARLVDLEPGREATLEFAITPDLVPQVLIQGIPTDLPETSGSVTGSVVDHASGDPVPGVLVSVGGPDLVQITNEEGRFLFPAVGPGPYAVKAEMMGRTTVEDTIRVIPEEILLVTIRMPVEAIRVAGILVEVESRELGLEIAGFYERAEHQNGIFITRDQIEERQPITTVDLFEGHPSVRVVRGGIQRAVMLTGSRIISFDPDVDPNRGPKPCYPAVWLDGMPVHAGATDTPAYIDNLVDPYQIAGVEVYTSAARIPVQFNIASACGVIVIWTR